MVELRAQFVTGPLAGVDGPAAVEGGGVHAMLGDAQPSCELPDGPFEDVGHELVQLDAATFRCASYKCRYELDHDVNAIHPLRRGAADRHQPEGSGVDSVPWYPGRAPAIVPLRAEPRAAVAMLAISKHANDDSAKKIESAGNRQRKDAGTGLLAVTAHRPSSPRTN